MNATLENTPVIDPVIPGWPAQASTNVHAQASTNVHALKVKLTSPEGLKEQLQVLEATRDIRDVRAQLATSGMEMGKNQLDCCRLRAEIGFKILSKFLPDLKVTDGVLGDTPSKVTFVLNMGDSPPKVI